MRPRLALVSLLAACGPKVPAQPPGQAEPTPPAPAVEVADRPSAPEAAPETAEASEPPIGISACDEYLARYRECEPQLQAEIQAGDRRAYRAERGWIAYLRDSPEGAQLAEACREMTTELDQACPD